MRAQTFISIIASSASLAIAAPATTPVPSEPGLRLIKTSASDPGIWVTEGQKYLDYIVKDIEFVDITGITVRTLYPDKAQLETHLNNSRTQKFYESSGIPTMTSQPSTQEQSPIPRP